MLKTWLGMEIGKKKPANLQLGEKKDKSNRMPNK